jgi:hypothetical protein
LHATAIASASMSSREGFIRIAVLSKTAPRRHAPLGCGP